MVVVRRQPPGQPYLEPAFVVRAPAALPAPGGAYAVAGRNASGEEVFSLRFDMLEVVDGEGGSSFAFTLPVEPEWAGSVASISLRHTAEGYGDSALATGSGARLEAHFSRGLPLVGAWLHPM